MSEQEMPTPAGQAKRGAAGLAPDNAEPGAQGPRRHLATYAQIAGETASGLASLAGRLSAPVTAESAATLAGMASRSALEAAALAAMLNALARHFAGAPSPVATSETNGPEVPPGAATPLDWAAIKAEADAETAAMFEVGRVERPLLGSALDTLTKGARHHVQSLADAGIAGAEDAAEGVAHAFSILAHLLKELHALRHGLSMARAIRGRSSAGADHPDFRAVAHAIESAENFTKWTAELDGGLLRLALHALGDIQQGIRPAIFTPATPMAGNSQGSATATARALAICAMEARHQARIAGGAETPDEAARRIEACFKTKEHHVRKIRTWHHKARRELEELAGLRSPAGEGKSSSRTERARLEMFAQNFLAAEAARRPADATGWYRLAEVYEAQLRELTGATPPGATPPGATPPGAGSRAA